MGMGMGEGALVWTVLLLTAAAAVAGPVEDSRDVDLGRRGWCGVPCCCGCSGLEFRKCCVEGGDVGEVLYFELSPVTVEVPIAVVAAAFVVP